MHELVLIYERIFFFVLVKLFMDKIIYNMLRLNFYGGVFIVCFVDVQNGKRLINFGGKRKCII